MEINTELDQHIIEWLASSGCPSSGMPGEVLKDMLLHESGEWELTPEELEIMVLAAYESVGLYVTDALTTGAA